MDPRRLDPGICWQAIYTRDPRFDGRFFTAATTTGLYCRNVCPGPFAQPRNATLFACAASAESAGYRPCKRCQPQAVPGTPAWLGTSAVVSRALRLILDGALNSGGVDDLAGRLGLGARQLRRLFTQHLGASPLKIAVANRVQAAKRLLDDPALSITEIAFRSGFNSIREFNHSVRLFSGVSPSKLRCVGGTQEKAAIPAFLELQLPYSEPFDWARMIASLKQTAVPGVEAVTEDEYGRTIEIDGSTGFFTARKGKRGSRIVVRLQLSDFGCLAQVVSRIRNLFDLSADLKHIEKHLSRDPKLRRLIQLHPGLRVPGTWDGFEASVFAVMAQSIAAPALKSAVARLVRTFGDRVETSVAGMNYSFPRPEVLAAANLPEAGIMDAAAETIRNLAGLMTRGHNILRSASTLQDAIAQLRTVHGIDEGTADHIAMRAFGDPDAFPSSDLGMRRILGGSRAPGSPELAVEMTEQWRPWRAYAAMHIIESSEALAIRS